MAATMARKHLRELAKNLDDVVNGGAVLIALVQYIQRSSAGETLTRVDSAVRADALRYVSLSKKVSVPDWKLQFQAVDKFFAAGRRAQLLLTGDETVKTLVRLIGRDTAIEWRSRLDPCLDLLAQTKEHFALEGSYRAESERPSLKRALPEIEACKNELECHLSAAGLEAVFSHGKGSYSLDGEAYSASRSGPDPTSIHRKKTGNGHGNPRKSVGCKKHCPCISALVRMERGPVGRRHSITRRKRKWLFH
jgi:hypothetical protein